MHAISFLCHGTDWMDCLIISMQKISIETQGQPRGAACRLPLAAARSFAGAFCRRLLQAPLLTVDGGSDVHCSSFLTAFLLAENALFSGVSVFLDT